MRHNCIRDLEAEIMQEVCSDVRIAVVTITSGLDT